MLTNDELFWSAPDIPLRSGLAPTLGEAPGAASVQEVDAYIKAVQEAYQYHGNDVSNAGQGVIAYSAFMASQRPSFVIIRGTIGMSRDKMAVTNVLAFSRLKVPVGLYFVPVGHAAPRGQLDTVKALWDEVGECINFRGWVDIELPGVTPTLIYWLKDGFLDRVLGHQAGYYTNLNWYRTYEMDLKPWITRRFGWFAQYANNAQVTQPNIPGPAKSTAAIWQYSPALDGRDAGCESYGLDGNVLLGVHDLKSIATGPVHNGTPDPAPSGPFSIRTRYNLFNFRTSPTTKNDKDTVAGKFVKAGLSLPAYGTVENSEGVWYKIVDPEAPLYIHSSGVIREP